MHKREDGFVVVNEEVCIGCRYCHMACPYGAPQYNADKGHMTKCDGLSRARRRGEKSRSASSPARCGRWISGRLPNCALSTASGRGSAAAVGALYPAEYRYQT